MIKMGIDELRSRILLHQGLLLPVKAKKPVTALESLKQLSYVQLDTLSVVSRAHHHTLWNRVPSYREADLDDLVKKKQAFEYWSHAASILPISEYRFSLFRKNEYAAGKSHWFAQDKKLKKYVLDRILAEGPLQSKDFEHERTGPGNWYEWKPAKRALEQLFMEGKLVVSERKGFQKVYDIAGRWLPADLDVSMPGRAEVARQLIRNGLRAQFCLTAAEIAYLRKGMLSDIRKQLALMEKEGELTTLHIKETGQSYFVQTNALKLNSAWSKSASVLFLSPFDNLVIQRKRLLQIFDFDYQIECYLPEEKRRFGYFTLPVLYNGRFIGRFDPKADRAGKTFVLKSFYFEKGFKPNDEFTLAFVNQLKQFAHFNGCEDLSMLKVASAWKKQVMAAWKELT